MRRITKREEPRALLQWKADNRAVPENLRYGKASFPSEEVRQALLEEQNHLCAYTMKRLLTARECGDRGKDTRHSCHIEHVLPQARGVPEEAIDYRNMVACFPPSDSTKACSYGAQAKADYDPTIKPFVSPLDSHAEQHFEFDQYGVIRGLTPKGQATVEVLRLNHKLLQLERAEVIKRALEPRSGRRLSAAEARRLARNVLQPDGQGCLSPFCVAVSQVAIAHAEREERRAIRMKKKPAP